MISLDLFAGGAGGWSHAAGQLGVRMVGVELDPDSCATRRAAGLLTVRADVTSLDPSRLAGRLGLLTGSPPCTDFSSAGLRRGMGGETGSLVWEPLRWIEQARPTWVALEQVKECLPVWRSYRSELRRWGYSVWCGLLDAAAYGTPQHRKRAILLARLDGPPVQPPVPSHCKGGREAGLFGGPALLPLVSMAAALGWPPDGPDLVETQNGSAAPSGNMFDPRVRPSRTICGARTPRFLYTNGTSGRSDGRRVPIVADMGEPAPTVDTKAGRGQWKLDRRASPSSGALFADLDEPAPAVTTEAGCQHQWQLRHPGRTYPTTTTTPLDQPAPAVALGHNQTMWCCSRPATTIQGDRRVWPPGHHANADQPGESRNDGAIPVELWQLGVLQDFPPDHPWKGNKTSVARQIGNAVPVRLAHACLSSLLA